MVPHPTLTGVPIVEAGDTCHRIIVLFGNTANKREFLGNEKMRKIGDTILTFTFMHV